MCVHNACWDIIILFLSRCYRGKAEQTLSGDIAHIWWQGCAPINIQTLPWWLNHSVNTIREFIKVEIHP